MAVATACLVPVLFIWKSHELRCWAGSVADPDADASAAHTAIARQMLKLALANGGIYVKGTPPQPTDLHRCSERLHSADRASS